MRKAALLLSATDMVTLEVYAVELALAKAAIAIVFAAAPTTAIVTTLTRVLG